MEKQLGSSTYWCRYIKLGFWTTKLESWVLLLNHVKVLSNVINPLTPDDLYMSRTAPLTSKLCILYIYSTNVGTEYFKHLLYSPFFSLQNAVCFANLFGSCIIHILYTGCAEIKKNMIHSEIHSSIPISSFVFPAGVRRPRVAS